MQWCGKVGEVSRDRIFNLFLESKSAFGYDKHIITEIQTTISRKSNPRGEVGFAGTNRDKQHKSSPRLRQPAVCDSGRG